MTQEEKRFYYAELCRNYFDSKQHTIGYKEFAGNKFEFRTYEVEVALFGDDFHEPPKVETMRVRLSDDEYLRLLQWQLQNPTCGFNHYDIDPEAKINIEYEVEDRFYEDEEIGTYAVYLTEIKRDAEMILRTLNENKEQNRITLNNL